MYLRRVLCMLIIGVLGGCSSSSDHDAGATGWTPPPGVSTDGPIASQVVNHILLTGGVASHDKQFWTYNERLQNFGNQPVILDRVALGTVPGVSPLRIVRAAIVGPDRNVGGAPPSMLDAPLLPFTGFKVPPQSTLTKSEQEAGYLLELQLQPGPAQRSYNSWNDGIQVYYHDMSGRRYVALFNMQYVICISLTKCPEPPHPKSS